MADHDHWMRLHIGDYLGDTQHLSTFQHGIYLLLIMHCFKKGSLPAERIKLMHIAKISDVRNWLKAAPDVLAMFQQTATGYRHRRVDAELVSAQALSGKRKKAAEKRWYGSTNGGNSGNSEPCTSEPCTTDTVPKTAQVIDITNSGACKSNASHIHIHESPPGAPPKGGHRRRRDFRNGFAQMLHEMMEEKLHA